MHQPHHRVRERDPRHRATQSHGITRLLIRAAARCLNNILRQKLHSSRGISSGKRVGLQTGSCLDGMRQGIHTGARCSLRRQALRHHGIQHSYIRLHIGRKELHLDLSLIVTNDSHTRTLRTRPTGRGNGDERDIPSLGQTLETADTQQIIHLLRKHQAHPLGCIQHRTTTDRNQGITVQVTVVGSNTVDNRQRRINGDIRKTARRRASLRLHGLNHATQRTDAVQHGIRQHQGPRRPQLFQFPSNAGESGLTAQKFDTVMKLKVWIIHIFYSGRRGNPATCDHRGAESKPRGAARPSEYVA